MESLRDIKARSRRDLHQAMRVPALYFEFPGSPGVEVNVRVHSDFQALGDMKGTNFHYAERKEFLPRIIFDATEVPKPTRGAIVSMGGGEAYRVDHAMPPDGGFITAECAVLSRSEAERLPGPEG